MLHLTLRFQATIAADMHDSNALAIVLELAPNENSTVTGHRILFRAHDGQPMGTGQLAKQLQACHEAIAGTKPLVIKTAVDIVTGILAPPSQRTALVEIPDSCVGEGLA
jgi:hypothetical protein